MSEGLEASPGFSGSGLQLGPPAGRGLALWRCVDESDGRVRPRRLRALRRPRDAALTKIHVSAFHRQIGKRFYSSSLGLTSDLAEGWSDTSLAHLNTDALTLLGLRPTKDQARTCSKPHLSQGLFLLLLF